MTNKEAKEFILKIAYGIGTTAMDYWGIETREKLIEAVNALEEPNTGITIPDNATNGDVIKALFPNGVPKDVIWTLSFDKCLDWWNAPYKIISEG